MHIYTKEEQEILRNNIKKHGLIHQVAVAIEELSELSLAYHNYTLSKEYFLNLCEEIADTEIALTQLEMVGVCNDTESCFARKNEQQTIHNMIHELTRFIREEPLYTNTVYTDMGEYINSPYTDMIDLINFLRVWLEPENIDTIITKKLRRMKERYNLK